MIQKQMQKSPLTFCWGNQGDANFLQKDISTSARLTQYVFEKPQYYMTPLNEESHIFPVVKLFFVMYTVSLLF